jgi:hypothetical protein
VDWLERLKRAPPQEPKAEQEETEPGWTERSAPGLVALFAGMSEDGSHTLLDFGSADGTSLRLYSGFARRIRFADLLPDPPHGKAWAKELKALPPHPSHLYDLVLAWDILDRLAPPDRPPLVERVAQLTAPGARLYAVVDLSGDSTTRPLRFSLLDLSRVRQEVVGPPRPAFPQVLPADLERLLEPFRVEHAFTLRLGFREYVAIKR